jgi:hypothetical protein
MLTIHTTIHLHDPMWQNGAACCLRETKNSRRACASPRVCHQGCGGRAMNTGFTPPEMIKAELRRCSLKNVPSDVLCDSVNAWVCVQPCSFAQRRLWSLWRLERTLSYTRRMPPVNPVSSYGIPDTIVDTEPALEEEINVVHDTVESSMRGNNDLSTAEGVRARRKANGHLQSKLHRYSPCGTFRRRLRDITNQSHLPVVQESY